VTARLPLSTALSLVDARRPAAGGRARLVAAGTAVAGALLLAAAAVLRVPAVAPWNGPDRRYSDLVAESGLRPGVVSGILLLVVPTLLLAWQAVTTGGARRAAAQRALRLTGATTGDLRRLAAVETGVAGVLGGLLAGPAYLLLWLPLGALAPAAARLFPALGAADLLGWAAVVLLATAGGAAAGAAEVRTRARSRRWPLALALLLGAAAVVLLWPHVSRTAQVALFGAGLGVLVVAAVLLVGTAWSPRRARRLARSGRAEDVLAAAGLRALAPSAGRTAGALFAAGAALGVATGFLGTLGLPGYGDLSGYLPGLALTAAAAVLAVVAAVVSLALAAADDLVTTARAQASLVALGSEPAFLERVQRRRLRAVTVGPVATGTLLFGVGYGLLGAGPTVYAVLLVVPATATALVAALGTWAACAGVVRLLRPRLASAAAPTRLRVA
jgi:hypothetical protein